MGRYPISRKTGEVSECDDWSGFCFLQPCCQSMLLYGIVFWFLPTLCYFSFVFFISFGSSMICDSIFIVLVLYRMGPHSQLSRWVYCNNNSVCMISIFIFRYMYKSTDSWGPPSCMIFLCFFLLLRRSSQETEDDVMALTLSFLVVQCAWLYLALTL